MDGLLRFGIFLPPHHRPNQSPAMHLQSDLEQITFADRRGFDEFWVGEHHGGGWEIISSPELMVAVAAQHTSRIKLGTGVASLPYQHPFITLNRAIQLDHLTRGRFMFGTGPGGHVSDALMMDLKTDELRRRQEESLDAIMALLRYEGPVTRETDWFRLKNAELHIPTYTQPRFEIVTTAVASPSGPTLAGKFGLSLLSLGSTTPAGFEFLSKTWAIVEETARLHGTVVDNRNWRLTGPMHIAQTEEQARQEVAYGLPAWVDDYWDIVGHLPLQVGETDINKRIESINELGFAVIGTPDMAIAQIKRLQQQAPGFGTYLLAQFDWASPENTLKSLDLFARYVMPKFQNQLEPQQNAHKWHIEHKDEIKAIAQGGRAKAAAEHEQAQTTPKTSPPQD